MRQTAALIFPNTYLLMPEPIYHLQMINPYGNLHTFSAQDAARARHWQL
jgi:hypothetical protein